LDGVSSRGWLEGHLGFHVTERPTGEAFELPSWDPQQSPEAHDREALGAARRLPPLGQQVGSGAANPQHPGRFFDGEERRRRRVGIAGWFGTR
jgi:hypothetical protein